MAQLQASELPLAFPWRVGQRSGSPRSQLRNRCPRAMWCLLLPLLGQRGPCPQILLLLPAPCLTPPCAMLHSESLELHVAAADLMVWQRLQQSRICGCQEDHELLQFAQASTATSAPVHLCPGHKLGFELHIGVIQARLQHPRYGAVVCEGFSRRTYEVLLLLPVPPVSVGKLRQQKPAHGALLRRVGEEEVQDLLLVVPSFDDQPKALADLLFEAGAESL